MTGETRADYEAMLRGEISPEEYVRRVKRAVGARDRDEVSTLELVLTLIVLAVAILLALFVLHVALKAIP